MKRIRGQKTGIFVLALFTFAPLARAETASHGGLKPAPVISWREASKHVGQYCCVEGRIRSARNIGSICFLNFGTKKGEFCVVIFKRFYANFPQPPEKLYAKKRVRVWGFISEYQGKAQIVVSHPVQIEAEGVSAPKARPMPKRIRLGTYNVENLFDGKDDPYVADESRRGVPYAKGQESLNALCATIRHIDADVLGLQEVENRGFLRQLVSEKLPDCRYGSVVLVEGNDNGPTGRGIDVALLSRFPLGRVTSFQYVEFKDSFGIPRRFARDALRAEVFVRPDYKLITYVLHLKSRYGGEPAQLWRNAEARTVRDIVQADLRAGERVVVLGDFNDDPPSKTVKTLLASRAGKRLIAVTTKDRAGRQTTWRGTGYPHVKFDYILLGPTLAKRVVRGSGRIWDDAQASIASDHRPSFVDIRIP